jgi:hypothetical protein
MLHQVFTITTFQITGENPVRAVWDQQQESPLNLRGDGNFRETSSISRHGSA